jgi:hypothetical protein
LLKEKQQAKNAVCGFASAKCTRLCASETAKRRLRRFYPPKTTFRKLFEKKFKTSKTLLKIFNKNITKKQGQKKSDLLSIFIIYFHLQRL